MKFKKLNEEVELETILKESGIKFQKISKSRGEYIVDFGEFEIVFVREKTIPGAWMITVESSTLDDLVKVGETLKQLGKINFADWT